MKILKGTTPKVFLIVLGIIILANAITGSMVGNFHWIVAVFAYLPLVYFYVSYLRRQHKPSQP